MLGSWKRNLLYKTLWLLSNHMHCQQAVSDPLLVFTSPSVVLSDSLTTGTLLRISASKLILLWSRQHTTLTTRKLILLMNTGVYLPPATESALSTHSRSVVINQDNIVDSSHANKFAAVHRRYDTDIDPAISTYNHKSEDLKLWLIWDLCYLKQREGRIPQYSRYKLVEPQARFDELEALGILMVIEYLNPSFLVNKSNRPNEYRFLTAFTEVGKYCKPQPSLMPSVDSTQRDIARWKFLIKTNLTSAFYQIQLAKNSMIFFGVVSPFNTFSARTRVFTFF